MERTSGQMLLEARQAASLTQTELARLAATSQSAIAAYESGAREPTVPVLERMIAATGHRLHLQLERDTSLYCLTDVAVDVAATTDGQRRLRLVFEFLRSAERDGHPLRLLVATEPRPTGDPRFDALLAAVAEDLCVASGIRPPAWVHRAGRFLPGFWWVADLPSSRAGALVNTPASYRRRGVMIERRDLTVT